jgi:hypothetical protein
MEETVEPFFPHYNKVLTLGDPYIADLLNGPIVVEEKVDGAQFRFGKINGKLMCGSHRIDYGELHEPDAMFQPAWLYVSSILERLPDNVMFYAEFLGRVRQNKLVYERTPKNGLMLFDAYLFAENRWADLEELGGFSYELDIDPPWVLYEGDGKAFDKAAADKLLGLTSFLGKTVIEGIVIKNYGQPGGDRYHHGPSFACGKFVQPKLAEKKPASRPAKDDDILSQVVARFKTEARWEKAVQHLKEDGRLDGSMRDVKALLDEVEQDLVDEELVAIEDMLWSHFCHAIHKGIRDGLPEWYKKRLSAQQFADSHPTGETPERF